MSSKRLAGSRSTIWSWRLLYSMHRHASQAGVRVSRGSVKHALRKDAGRLKDTRYG